ncbi:MAG: hypothetical protein ACK4WM_04850 [Thermoflexales bacterium]
MTTTWDFAALKAAREAAVEAVGEATGNWPNVHGVPADAIERMRARWEHIEGEQQ